ncbi:PAS domain S-box protein [Myxococcus sp. K15C18031901]|uniref:sensor histidine kinase n=1 Tax=Myxococcus dinghuensis TaxID=2906761 RepID=UPI0020A74D01|nr:PAS domain S-box protein [Myxococcus dinghuensis]MCP3104303.1 PAS domain S-box protein [Myxococcus dinghuensis]
MCLIVALVATAVLLGWGLGAWRLVQVVSLPGAGMMMPNTALGLLCAATGLRLLQDEEAPRAARRRVGRGLAIAVLLLGVFTLAEYLIPADLGIDRFLFADTVRRLAPKTPGRPSPLTSVCFVLTGTALLLLHVQTRRGWHPARPVALLQAILAAQALISYVYLEEPRLGPPQVGSHALPYYPVAIHTALLFLLLALGILAVHPRHGIIGVLLRDDAGGLTARRLLPATVLLPLIVWGLHLLSERHGLWGLPFNTSVFALITVAVFLAILARNANALSGLDVRQRSSERSLRVSEARFASIINHAADAIITIDSAQHITLYNTTAERVFGYTRDEALGRPLDELLPYGLKSLEADGDTPVVTEGRQPLVGRRRNGEEFPAEATIAQFQTDEAVQRTVILRDISARVRAEEVLRDREELFRAAFEHAPIGLSLVDLDGRFLTVNEALCAMLGYSRAELLQRTFQDITYPEDLATDLEHVRELLRGQRGTYQMEKRYFHKQGPLVTVQLTASLVRGARGEPLYFISQLQDITEQKFVEESRRLLAEAGPSLASSLDPHTTLLTVSQLVVPSMADFCITAMLDPHGRLIAQTSRASAPEKRHMLAQMLQEYPLVPFSQGHMAAQVFETGQPVLLPDIPEALLRQNAEDARHESLLHQLAPRSCIIVPLSARGRTVGILILVASESGRRYGKRELRLAEDLALRAGLAIDNANLHAKSEQATHLRDEVLRIVAHDLRSPLNIISLSAGTLLKRPATERGNDPRPLEAIQKAVTRATHLIEDLLDVARLQGGHLSVERRPESTYALFREAYELHRALAEANQVHLHLDVPLDLPAVFVDRDRVLQLLSNLVGNALKFTPTGGAITLRAEPGGDVVRCSVSDTGSGIPEDDLRHLFEPFWQARKGREGAGLGLTIVKGITEAHGGRVWVESRPGVGSTFFFSLPVFQDATTSRPEWHV